ncbi:D-ribose pyranase [Pullulanibacillus sp. KACC 23026]|uniref:D-ribose pyranase n=1 Tax=Pullulanibacillus sp. KACC 23026 TaxID=3028315 RepID=UPI0023B0E160|nr:D-ribose pyranase [Pullulanibacillus sp. KACC 23026]WEG13324.1 D-ribose pyranase [Pullulanibacillus sp. KACC 23026]
MKSSGILHGEMSKVVALLGHGDTIVISDCGLPVPPNVQLIDLAVTTGVPDFLIVLKAVTQELHVEACTVAEELETNPTLLEKISSLIKLEPEKITHERFKEETQRATAIIRTGEFTPYSNVILTAGVPF